MSVCLKLATCVGCARSGCRWFISPLTPHCASSEDPVPGNSTYIPHGMGSFCPSPSITTTTTSIPRTSSLTTIRPTTTTAAESWSLVAACCLHALFLGGLVILACSLLYFLWKKSPYLILLPQYHRRGIKIQYRVKAAAAIEVSKDPPVCHIIAPQTTMGKNLDTILVSAPKTAEETKLIQQDSSN